jgi:hypothetical protein
MRTEIRERVTVLQAQIPVHDQIIASDITKSANQNTSRPKWADGHIVSRFRGYRNIIELPLVSTDVPPAAAGYASGEIGPASITLGVSERPFVRPAQRQRTVAGARMRLNP